VNHGGPNSQPEFKTFCLNGHETPIRVFPRPSSNDLECLQQCSQDSTVQHNSTMADFAPYQDQSPETNRALSPPPLEGRRSFSPGGQRSPALPSPTNASKPHVNPWAPIDNSSARAFGNGGGSGGFGGDIESGRGRLNEFETSLPIRLDYEACLAYLLLPPAGGVLLLVMEQKSDYVRLVCDVGC